MQKNHFLQARQGTKTGLHALCLSLFLAITGTGCDDSSSSGSSSTDTSTGGSTDTQPIDSVDQFASRKETARFLTQATFGPIPAQLDTLTGTSTSAWFRAELEKPASLVTPFFQSLESQLIAAESGDGSGNETANEEGESETEAEEGAEAENEDAESEDEEGVAETEIVFDKLDQYGFWNNALRGDDQLRQRVAFALSQIVVASDVGEVLADFPGSMAYYQYTLIRNALGNYRQLLEEVTYSPAMGHWLTYMGNQKGDPATGRIPDENYAREILQLFSIGLVNLNPDGTPQIGADGNPVETYTNDDIGGLARVFTGLDIDLNGGFSVDMIETDPNYYQKLASLWARPMRIFPERHSALEKRFLGSVIPANTDAATSITMALDTIFNHPNVGPFIGRQLIQRLVTSHPEPQYIARVSAAFNSGSYTLPDGGVVGSGQRGDLAATVAAVLFDDEARMDVGMQSLQFGKLREPVLRLSAWARAFGAEGLQAEYIGAMALLGDPQILAQQAYTASSVFNFYRPGYVASGTLTGEMGLTMPEFQLVNSVTIPGSIETLNGFVANQHVDIAQLNTLASEISAIGITIDPAAVATAARAKYSALEAVAVSDTAALLDLVDERLIYGNLSANTRASIKAIIDALPANPQERAQTAVMLVMSSPDFLIQR